MSDRLLLRPGCCFDCHGDGTCCTNIHVIGPLSQRDAERVREAGSIVFPKRRTVVRKDKGLDRLVVVMDHDACVFLDADARCMIHGDVDPAYKPAACRRFPVGATATPDGVRVTLSHRCACVSIGRSAPLQQERARQILVDPWSGRLARDHVVGDRVRWQGRSRIKFHDYVAWERSMLASLDRDDGPPIEQVLGLTDGELPPMRTLGWSAVADRMAKWTTGEPFSDGFFCTLRWAEGAIRYGLRWTGPFPRRPWGWTFERAGRREPDEGSPRRIYGSWLADELWGMGWTARGSVYATMADLSARYLLAKRVAAGLEHMGTRPDLAAAEGVMIADTLGAWESWQRVRIRLLDPAQGTFG